ncbi:heme-binding protein [Mycolicibacterium sp. 018/SC-01/001]|uniref:SOUL family heme-binding protein n=1 Tax=Mycolicibacterium sp. 018/SC-01/001 TaxID=2592069 RepID=UPI00117E8AC0|nr:heme-binding protein [Mycolicibacterium sp. 018/SC-01/001]TRW86332.1 heme-binding protein [Mycolicibacterium sp. 018/SC-01/001]
MKPLKFVGQLAESALSIVGVRTVEEPHYIARPLTDRVQIRQYGSRIAAETTVSGEKQKALNTGFRRLAGYIFGGNHRDTEIAMTAPVSQAAGKGANEEIAMTAPVSQTGNADEGWTVRFFMPSKWSLETLPEPDDENVRLVTVPPQTVAVLSFTGDRSAAAVAARGEELRTTLQDNGIEPKSEPTAWFYDPPWTLPFRRRNEVVIDI